MLNPFKLLAIYGDLNKLQAVAKEKANMQVKVPQLLALLVSLSATIGLPTLVTNWVHVHAAVYLAIVAVAIVLHALMPSVFSAPSASDTQATGLSKAGVILLMIGLGAMCAARAQAQAATPAPAPTAAPTATFTGGSDAIALRYAGAWGTGNLTTESFDLMDFGATKSEHLFLEGKELIGAQSGINTYTGGVKFQPDLSKVLAKTNVSPSTFGMYVSGSAGVGMLNTGGSHIAFMLGGGIEYRSNSTLSWNPLQIQYVRIGNQNAVVISTGLSFVFGQK
jgi:hypothetical protein